MKLRRSAFTLIELLVVISIIALLSSVVLSSLNTARAKARDAKRVQDLKQIQLAVEMFYSDNGYYPSSGENIPFGDFSINASDPSKPWVSLSPLLSKYMPTLPLDPINTQTGNVNYRYYAYLTATSTSGYLCGAESWNNYQYLLVFQPHEAKYGLPSTWQGGNRCLPGPLK